MKTCSRSSSEQVNPFPNKPWFLRFLPFKSFENTMGKGYRAISPFPTVFLPPPPQQKKNNPKIKKNKKKKKKIRLRTLSFWTSLRLWFGKGLRKNTVSIFFKLPGTLRSLVVLCRLLSLRSRVRVPLGRLGF